MQVNLLDFILKQQSVLVLTVGVHCRRHRHFFVTFLETCCVQASYRRHQVFAFWRSEAKIVRHSTSSDTGEVMGVRRNCSTCTASPKCRGLWRLWVTLVLWLFCFVQTLMMLQLGDLLPNFDEWSDISQRWRSFGRNYVRHRTGNSRRERKRISGRNSFLRYFCWTPVKPKYECYNLYQSAMFAGGSVRKCRLDDEAENAGRVMRSSGDIVRRDSTGNIFFVSRADDLRKRHGKRVSLTLLEQVVGKEEHVESVVALLTTRVDLYLFVKPSTTITADVEKLPREIRIRIQNDLPSQYRPTFVTTLPRFPMTSHGKSSK